MAKPSAAQPMMALEILLAKPSLAINLDAAKARLSRLKVWATAYHQQRKLITKRLHYSSSPASDLINACISFGTDI